MSGGGVSAAASSRRGPLVGSSPANSRGGLSKARAHGRTMQRLVSRQRAWKATQVLSGAHSQPALRMDASLARAAAVGDARLGMGRLGGRRALAESGKKTVAVRPRRRSGGRIESSADDFSAQRLLECAVDVLRSFNEQVNGLRARWGAQGFSSAAQEKAPEARAEESEAPDAMEAAPPAAAAGGEFEWRSALWEEELWAKHREDPLFAEPNRQSEAVQASAGGADAADAEAQAEVEVDIGELWSSGGADPQRWSSRRGVEEPAAAATQPSPATESPREAMEPEAVRPSAPDLEGAGGELAIERRAGWSWESLSVSDAPALTVSELEEEGLSAHSLAAHNSVKEEAPEHSSLASEEQLDDRIAASFAHEAVEPRPLISEAAEAAAEAEHSLFGVSASVSSQEELEGASNEGILLTEDEGGGGIAQEDIEGWHNLPHSDPGGPGSYTAEGDPLQDSEEMDGPAEAADENHVLPGLNIPAQRAPAGMDKRKLREEIDRLREALAGHAYLYHSNDAQTVSDGTYDSLLEELKRLELQQASNSSPSVPLPVGAPVSPGVSKVQHSSPMLSLASTQKEAEVRSWYGKLQERLGSGRESVGWVVEPKVDGLALSLNYEAGELKHAATRGDGSQGEDVTQNVDKVRGIPRRLGSQHPDLKDLVTGSPSLEVRGEVFMPLESYRELNKSKVDSGLSPLLSPRNAAAGAMRAMPSESTDSDFRPLGFMAFSATLLPPPQDVPDRFQKQWDVLHLLECSGFTVNDANRRFDSFEDALDYAKRWRSDRGDLKYEADGVVFKVDDLVTQAFLGNTGGEPRWAIAWKFEATEAATVLEEIEINVGRTGAITPIAHFKPVELAGAVINRASLHNVGHVKALRLCIGDHIVVQRAGDVIPKVLHALLDLRKEGAKPWAPPDQCPTCGSTLEWRTSGMVVMCPNRDCGSRHARQVAHYAKTLIPWLGPSTLRLLEDNHLVTSPADFYNLDLEKLTKLPGIGKAKATRILKAIEDSKQQELSSFILAFGIPNVGLNTAKDLAKTFKSMRGLHNASINNLFSVPGVGWGTSQCIYDWCRSAPNVAFLRTLEAAGCRLNPPAADGALPSGPSSAAAAAEKVEDNFATPAAASASASAAAAAQGKSEGLTEALLYLESPGDAESVTSAGDETEKTGAVADVSGGGGGKASAGVSPLAVAANGDSDERAEKRGGFREEEQPQQPQQPQQQRRPLRLGGRTVVITGDFGPTPRDSVKDLVLRHGGVVRTSVTSKTALLLCGIKPGPAKVSEAERRQIEVMDWGSFLSSIDEGTLPAQGKAQ